MRVIFYLASFLIKNIFSNRELFHDNFCISLATVGARGNCQVVSKPLKVSEIRIFFDKYFFKRDEKIGVKVRKR